MTTNQLLRVPKMKLVYEDKVPYSERPKVEDSFTASEILRPFFADNMQLKECAFMILLNRKNKVQGVVKISEGGQSSTIIETKQVISPALLANSAAIILCHNHPSGNKTPSKADLALTRTINNRAKEFELSLLDHIILTKEGYTSLADLGEIY